MEHQEVKEKGKNGRARKKNGKTAEPAPIEAKKAVKERKLSQSDAEEIKQLDMQLGSLLHRLGRVRMDILKGQAPAVNECPLVTEALRAEERYIQRLKEVAEAYGISLNDPKEQWAFNFAEMKFVKPPQEETQA